MPVHPFVRKLLTPLSFAAVGSMIVAPAFSGEPDPALALAVEKIWDGQAPAKSVLSKRYSTRQEGGGLVHEPDVKNGISLLSQDGKDARIRYQRHSFQVANSPWGGFPMLDTSQAQLTGISIPRRNYLVLSAPGEGLFSVADWSRFEFLHVLDVTLRGRPVHYPLVSEAGMGIRLLGQLPGSSVLNYARLVPSQWDAGQVPNEYEVTLYALQNQGLRKVISKGQPLTYRLRLEGEAWRLEAGRPTPVTDERDAGSRPFTSRPVAWAEVSLEADSQQQGGNP